MERETKVFTQERLEFLSGEFKRFLHEEEIGAAARAFIDSRGGLSLEKLGHYEVGMCPPRYPYPSRKPRFTMETHGWYIRGRLIVTVRDQYGDILGFAGRHIPEYGAEVESGMLDQFSDYDDYDSDVSMKFWDAAKWINEGYKKERYLYNLNSARDHILEAGFAVVIEGYLDIIHLDSIGVKNTVSPCGVALTPMQVSLLQRYTDKVVFCFDGDEAGVKASEKAAKICDSTLSWTDLRLPEGVDPEDYINIGDPNRQMLKEAISWAGGKTEYDGKILDLSKPATRIVIGQHLQQRGDNAEH